MEASPIAQPRILGRYALYGEIASGGMATVHLGRLIGPAGFSRTVAIKRLHPQFAKDPEFVAGFLDEARLASRIRHPNVVPTLDVVARDGELFLVMDYIQGEALSRLLDACRRQGWLVPPRVAAAILAGVLHGLHAAHEARSERGEPLLVVHRDVSPHNVLVAHDGIPFVLDFGIAKASTRVHETRDGSLRGKVAYMAPEQLSGGPTGRHTDIYAAAVVLWETLTTRRLFEAANDFALIELIKTASVPPPGSLVDLPAGLNAIVLQGLHRHPAQRFATARDMAVALERCVGLATPLEIADWLQWVAGEVLRSRSHMVESIEWYEASQGGALATRPLPTGIPPMDDSTRALPPIPEVSISDAPTRVIIQDFPTPSLSDAPTRAIEPVHVEPATEPVAIAPTKAGRHAFVVASVVAATAALGVVTAVLVTKSAATATGARASDAPSVGETTTAAAASAAPTTVTAAATASASASASESASAKPSATASPTATPSPAAARAAVKRSPCDPWYTVDSRGIKIPKPGCIPR
jgi:serine/threonine-protein kinase